VKVHELITKLSKLDPGALVVLEGDDHSYYRVDRVVGTEAMVCMPDGALYEHDPYSALTESEDLTPVAVIF
jgi:hypothetical protein